MNELRNSKSDDQLEELLLLTEQMQEELDQKDRTIRELKSAARRIADLEREVKQREQSREHSSLKERLEENKRIIAERERENARCKHDRGMSDKLRQAEQERDYALSHQKKVEIPVEKPVLYQKCGNCNQTAYLKARKGMIRREKNWQADIKQKQPCMKH
ncbi:hypothetical protein OBE_02801 [human gut metagenome]|uniref:Uncharacterized protein n=1 Tax=human gut metagenome TaxID=408170 RepID=K1UM57_9ZZZZ